MCRPTGSPTARRLAVVAALMAFSGFAMAGGPAAIAWAAVIAVQQQESPPAEALPNEEPPREGVTVRGQFVNPDPRFAEVKLTELQAALVENVQPRTPELPANWAQMTAEQRQQWVDEFSASEAGKELIAANEKLLQERLVVELTIEEDGSFVAYDVPRGEYGLDALLETKEGERTYALQTFGQVTVGEVDEVNLAAMPLVPIRILSRNEAAPDVQGPRVDGTADRLSNRLGKHVLLVFASVTHPGFGQTAEAIRQSRTTPGIQENLNLLVFAVDSDVAGVKKAAADFGFQQDCIAPGKWDASVLNEFGVQSVPSLWLIDAKGNVLVTDWQMLNALSSEGATLASVIGDALAGKLPPEEPPVDDQN
jgi:hypothetical protein